MNVNVETEGAVKSEGRGWEGMRRLRVKTRVRGEAERPRVKFKIRARMRVMAVTEGRQGVLGVEMRRPWWSDAPPRL